MDAISGTIVGRFTGHTGRVNQIAVNEVRGDVFATGSADMSVRVWRIGEESPVAILTDATHWVYSVGWSEDGRRLVSGSGDGSASACGETRCRRMATWIDVWDWIECFWSDDGRRRGSSGRGSGW